MNQEHGIDFLNCEERLEKLATCPEGHDTRHFYSWLDEIKRLLDKVESLKCCGNCKHYTPRGDCRSTQGYSPGHYCKFWYSDGLTKEGRE